MDSSITAALIAVIGSLAGAWAGSAISRNASSRATESANENSINIMRREEFNRASAKFRASFAPAIAHLKFPQSLGNIEAKTFFDSALTDHAIAIEEFRPFAKDGAAYQDAWDDYQKTVYGDDDLADASHKWKSNTIGLKDGTQSDNFLEVIENKIDNILHSAPIK